MPTIGEQVAVAKGFIRDAGIDSAALDARLLMEFSLSISHEELVCQINRDMLPDEIAGYMSLVQRRCTREPVAKIICKKPFWKYEFVTTKDTLDPRPDSETLIELVLENIKNRDFTYRILDFGTGSGCLLLTLLSELPNATGIGVDNSPGALEIAEKNAANLSLSKRAGFLKSNWGEQIKYNSVYETEQQKFDIILSNPPYIPRHDIVNLDEEIYMHEPHSALDGGNDGCDEYRKLAPCIKELLSENGFAIVEIGIGQEDKVESVMAQNFLYCASRKKDLSGITRALLFRR